VNRPAAKQSGAMAASIGQGATGSHFRLQIRDNFVGAGRHGAQGRGRQIQTILILTRLFVVPPQRSLRFRGRIWRMLSPDYSRFAASFQ
jgi:hypothetical protein